jgi:ABC-type phosphate/phosphonate transport system substrate-binding protein
LDFAGGHDKAARAVLDGTYDAAWLNDKNFQRFKDQGVGLRGIWNPYPEFPIAVNTAYLDAAVQERVLDALLAMHNSKDPDRLKAIDPKYERWVALDWQAYRPVKETIDRVWVLRPKGLNAPRSAHPAPRRGRSPPPPGAPSVCHSGAGSR